VEITWGKRDGQSGCPHKGFLEDSCPAGYVASSAHYGELAEQKLVFLPLYNTFHIGRVD